MSNLYKLAVLGAGAVGKSALTVRFIKGKFLTRYDPTIEDAYRKSMEVDGQACMLDILDTAGQEGYSSMLDAYLKDGEGFVLVYDITNLASFEKVDDLREHIQRSLEDQKACIVLVGNKKDLEEKRVVSEAEGRDKATAWQAEFLETSAKDNLNVDKIFETIVRTINKSRQRDVPAAGPHKKGKCVLL